MFKKNNRVIYKDLGDFNRKEQWKSETFSTPFVNISNEDESEQTFVGELPDRNNEIINNYKIYLYHGKDYWY
ncbi:MAG: hypothetical protein NC095_11210 [Muribaculum sp.]|nr:hypothetical protein [Muribaculum sp.]